MRQVIIKGLVWSLIQKWGSRFVSLSVFFILARLLDAKAFGLIALASIFIDFTQIFIDQGFSDAIIQKKNIEAEHLDTAFWINITTGLILTALGFFGAAIIADLFKEPQLTPIIRCLSVSFIFTALTSTQQAILRKNFAFKSLAKRTLAAQLVGSVVGVIMALKGFGVWSLVAQQLVKSVVGVAVLWHVSQWRPGLKFSVAHLKELSSFGISVLGFSFLNFFSRRSDDFLIGYYLGPQPLGYYTVAYRFLLIFIELLVGIITEVALPTFSKLQGDLGKLRNVLYQATQVTSFIALPTFLWFAIMAPELVKTFFGEQWMPSVPVMQVLSLVGIIQAVTHFNGSVLTAVGKPAWKFWLGCLSTILNVTAFALVVKWGIVAVAAAYVGRAYALAPISISLIKRVTNISLRKYFHQYITPLISSLIMLIIVSLVRHATMSFLNPYFLIACCLITGVLTYFITVRLLNKRLFNDIMALAFSLKGRKQGKLQS